jgi:signal transduction histidine kinase
MKAEQRPPSVLAGGIEGLLSLGTSDHLGAWDNHKTRLLNQILLIASLVAAILGIRNGILGNSIPAGFAFVLLALNSILFLLNYKSHQQFARLLACFSYPLLFFFIILISGLHLKGEYVLFLVVLVGIFFFQEKWLQLLIFGYVLGLFITSQLLLDSYPAPLPTVARPVDAYIIFSSVLSCVFFGANMFIRAMVESREKSQQLLQELLDSNTELKRFNFMVSHDLRTPLRQIVSFTDLARMANQKQDKDGVQDYLDYVGSSARQLYTLTEDLLSLAHLDHKTLEKSTVALPEIFDQVRAHFGNQSELLDLEISDQAKTLTGNATLIGIVLQNLIENGIKYNDSLHKKINITTEQQTDQVIIRIRDNGIGIPAGSEQKIFELFERLHNNNKYPGTGLGLAITRKIMMAHGGEIWVEPQETGSLFVLAFPGKVKEESKNPTPTLAPTTTAYRFAQQRRAIF